MSLFSDKLKSHILETGMTVYVLAKKAGVNRPMIHKAQQGDSVPNDDFILKLCEAMMLTPQEQRDLLLLARRARMGETLFLRRMAVLDVVNRLCQEFNEMDLITFYKDRLPIPPDKSYLVLKDQKQIEYILMDMIKKEAEKEGESSVYFYLPDHARELFSIIYHLWIESGEDRMKLVQIIGLEKEYQGNHSAVKNLGIISIALNYCLVPGKSFGAFYHYLDFPDCKSLPTMPFYVKTSEGLLVLSSGLDKGAFFRPGPMLDFYEGIIQETIGISKALVSYLTDLFEMFDCGSSQFTLIESIPCITTVMTDEWVEALVREELPAELRKTAVEAAQNEYRRIRRDDSHPISFFQMDKLERFMEDGRIPTVPVSLVRPCTEEERLAMLRGFRKEMDRTSNRIYYALDVNKLHLAVDAEVVYSEEKGVIIRVFKNDDAVLTTLLLQEPSCVAAFVDFFEHLPSSSIVLSKEEMIQRTDRLIAKYSVKKK